MEKNKTILSASAVWLPYTQMKTAPTPFMAEATHGSRIRLSSGRELIDGVASWWTACHGYNHPHLVAAIQKQLAAMPHIMLDGLVHEPALILADRLVKLAPGDLNHVFFSDSGSVAVEIALKMAVQYWVNKGVHGREKFIAFRHGYCGDTMGAISVCDPGDLRLSQLGDWLPEQFIVDLPTDGASMDALDRLMSEKKEDVAAVIIEPLIQGVGGMKFHDAPVLKVVADLCAKHELLLIADEVFTGFGRTGTMFACEQADVVPDILCLGKALSGGMITLAATLARTHVFEAFLSDNPQKALMHGPTYMANPLACAAANASLDLFEREPRLEQVAGLEMAMRRGLEPCRNLPGVVDVRVKGATGVVQFAEMKNRHDLQQLCIERGIWVRPFAHMVAVTPAFTIEAGDLAFLMSALSEAITVYGDTSDKRKTA